MRKFLDFPQNTLFDYLREKIAKEYTKACLQAPCKNDESMYAIKMAEILFILHRYSCLNL